MSFLYEDMYNYFYLEKNDRFFEIIIDDEKSYITRSGKVKTNGTTVVLKNKKIRKEVDKLITYKLNKGYSLKKCSK